MENNKHYCIVLGFIQTSLPGGARLSVTY